MQRHYAEVFVHITDRKTFEAVKTSWTMLYHIRTKYKDYFEINKPYTEGRPTLFHFEAGEDTIIENTIPLQEQLENLEIDSKNFLHISKNTIFINSDEICLKRCISLYRTTSIYSLSKS